MVVAEEVIHILAVTERLLCPSSSQFLTMIILVLDDTIRHHHRGSLNPIKICEDGRSLQIQRGGEKDKYTSQKPCPLREHPVGITNIHLRFGFHVIFWLSRLNSFDFFALLTIHRLLVLYKI